MRLWQNSLGFVPQNIFLSDATIKENIAFGLPAAEIDDEKIFHAVEMAHLKEFVTTLENGLDTIVGERGVKLSGGQRQRIGIARALYQDARFLILDEATSGMDTELEKSIYENIFNSNFKTIICITHKSSLLDRFDEIVVFNNGQIEASGSYKELIGKSEFFRTLSDKQSH